MMIEAGKLKTVGWMIHKVRKMSKLTDKERKTIMRYPEKISALSDGVDFPACY